MAASGSRRPETLAMATKQTFVKQPLKEYFVYDAAALEKGELHSYGAHSYKVVDGKLKMTESEARYYLGMGIIGTIPKDEWDNHFKLQEEGEQQGGQGADGVLRSRGGAPIDSRNDTHNATETGESETHDAT
jgi:hypothetical protein